KVAGELTRDDPIDPVLKKGLHKVYQAQLAAGAYYQIDLSSKDFNACLRLEDAQGKPLAEDNNAGGDRNARLGLKPERADAYRIIVTTYAAGATGKFLLTVKPIDRAAFEQHKLLQDADALHAAGMQLYRQAKLAEATERCQQALELLRQA